MAKKRSPSHHRVPTLMAIGGHESKEGEREILREFVRLVGQGRLIIATFASEQPMELWNTYKDVFRSLGARDVAHLQVDERPQAAQGAGTELLENAGAVFITGGDQLRLTSKIGGTALCDTIQRLYGRGVILAGTSAGASALTETMLVYGEGDRSHTIDDVLKLAPGLGFLPGIVIDQHFAERGRVGRLLGVVAQNPRALGIGIDENTAVVFEGLKRFRVIGAGAVYVLDGRSMIRSNVSLDGVARGLSAHGVTLHLLSKGDEFDLERRLPLQASTQRKENGSGS